MRGCDISAQCREYHAIIIHGSSPENYRQKERMDYWQLILQEDLENLVFLDEMGILSVKRIPKSLDGELFKAYIKEELLPKLWEGFAVSHLFRLRYLSIYT